MLLARAQAQGHISRFGEAQSPWSLAQLGFDDADYEILCAWYGALDPHQLTAYLGKTSAQQVRLPASAHAIDIEAEAAFGLLFLALAGETARRDGSWHDVWPHVARLECSPRVWGRLFSTAGHPTRDAKDALKAAAIRFGLRHAERTGSHEYYHTVLFQVGLPEGALSSLPALLAGTAPLPEVAASLLHPLHGDHAFVEFWGALKKCRGLAHAPATALEKIRTSPWLRSSVCDDVLALLRSTPVGDASIADDTAPLGAVRFRRDSLQLVATPQAFRPTFGFQRESVLDLCINGKHACRYTLDGGEFRPNDDDPINLPAVPDVAVELRSRERTLVGEPRSFVSWDEAAALVQVPTDEPGRFVLLVESDEAPEVQPVNTIVQRFAERWAVHVHQECTVRVDGNVVWTGGRMREDEIDVSVSLLSPFNVEAAGEILVEAASPWRVTDVNVAGVRLSLSPLDVDRTSFIASGLIQDLPTEPNVRARIVLDGPRGVRVVYRRLPLAAGAWMHVAGIWERIEPSRVIEKELVTGARRMRFSLPGPVGTTRTLLAGDLSLGPVVNGKSLARWPLGYGEPLTACAGTHGASAESETAHAICRAVVRRGIATEVATNGDAWTLILGEGWRLESLHRLVVWFADGKVGVVPLANSEQPVTGISLPAATRAAALCVGSTCQGVGWTADWSVGVATNEATAYAALLAIRAFGLPFLMEPHREHVRTLATTYPALTARAWLARDPLFDAEKTATGTSALAPLLEERDDGSEERWLSAVRQLLEPDWYLAYGSTKTANSVFDELRRAVTPEPKGDYRRAADRFFALGPQSTFGFCDSVEQPSNGHRESLRQSIANQFCETRSVRGRPPKEDRLLVAAEASLGLPRVRVSALLSLGAAHPSYRSAIHDEPFRRLALRHLLTAAALPSNRKQQ